ncbi:MAG: hypothetical protein KF729_22735 [Sandaracinaceae bacterium]|nr:hypothetical protein [Sandaracinaceae bacterium]
MRGSLVLWLVALAGCDGGHLGGRDAGADAASAGDAASASDAASATDDGGALDAGGLACPRLGAWRASAPWGEAASHPMPSFALGARFYVHTDGGRALQLADVGADGTLSAWRDAGDHGGGPHGFTALALGGEAYHFRNGHIARFRFRGDGALDGDVELLEESVETAFGGNRYVWDVAVALGDESAPRGIVHLGGFSFTGYAYRPHVTRSAHPIGARFERVGDFPVERPGNAAYVASGAGDGWIFAREAAGDRLFRARVAGLDVGAFEEIAPLPAGDDNGRGDLFAVGCTLFAIRGRRVFGAEVSAEGGLAPFEAQPALPEPQIDVSWGDGHQEGAAWGVASGHVHVTGPRRVYSAPILR